MGTQNNVVGTKSVCLFENVVHDEADNSHRVHFDSRGLKRIAQLLGPLMLHNRWLTANSNSVANRGFGFGMAQWREVLGPFGSAPLLCSTIYVVLDLDRPRRGLIDVSQTSMLGFKEAVQERDVEPPVKPGTRCRPSVIKRLCRIARSFGRRFEKTGPRSPTARCLTASRTRKCRWSASSCLGGVGSSEGIPAGGGLRSLSPR